MFEENFTPMFPIELVEKDLGYGLQAMDEKIRGLSMTSRTHEIFQRAVQIGFGNENITAITKLY